MNKEKVKQFIAKYRDEIEIAGYIFGAISMATVVTLLIAQQRKNSKYYIDKKYLDTIQAKPQQLPLPEKSVGKWVDFWVDGGSKLPTAIVTDVPWQFLGDLGAEIRDHCLENGIDADYDGHVVQMILEIVERK